MVRKQQHKITEEYDESGNLISTTEEFLTVETHDFLHTPNEEEDPEFDLWVLGGDGIKRIGVDQIDDEPPLIITEDDNNFW